MSDEDVRRAQSVLRRGQADPDAFVQGLDGATAWALVRATLKAHPVAVEHLAGALGVGAARELLPHVASAVYRTFAGARLVRFCDHQDRPEDPIGVLLPSGEMVRRGTFAIEADVPGGLLAGEVDTEGAYQRQRELPRPEDMNGAADQSWDDYGYGALEWP